ncbi:MAG TPA: acyltransferase domain-containing protein, partial [Armatimonadota bacterium]|nr:acyltransferase domain-containing protein [Armatimonadota bacterium]
MTLTDVLSELNITDSKPLFEDHWDESEASFPDELPRFLRPEMITNTREFGGLPADADAELHQAARLIAESPALVHLAWHCHRLVYEHLDYEAQNLGQWPVLTGALGDLSGAFYLLIGLEAVPRMLATHEPLGIPRQVSRDTFSHYPESTRIYRDQHDGHWGVSPRTLYWLRNHVRGILYRLGRHEYMLKPFHGGLKAYRHRETRNVIALAADGYRYAPDGFVARPDGADTWVAGLTESEGSVTGYPISPSGQAAHREVTLSLDEWELALSPGDYILEMHIPAGGNMTPEACHESMRRALEFFPHYFPKQRFVGFACGSWILNPEITQWYRPDSNM